MKDAPAFDFYPERWTHGTRMMSKVERCDYIDLLCQQWTDDGLPADVELLARIAGYRKASQLPSIVLDKFPISEDGLRRNPRLEIERTKQRERIEKRRDGAEKTNAKRWGKPSLSDRSATPERHLSESPASRHHPPPTTHHSPHVLLGKEPKDKPPAKVSNAEACYQANAEPIPLELNTQEFRSSWADWCHHRTSMAPRKPWTALSARNSLAECQREGIERSIQAIRKSIANGWQGITFDALQTTASKQRPSLPHL